MGAICEAVSRPVPGLVPGMRFVPIKTVEQQADAVTHKARQMLIKQRTMAMNSLRSLMAEFGIVVPQGPQHMVPRRKLWVVQGITGPDARRRWLQRRSGFGLVTPHRTARPILSRPWRSPSSPAPAAHRFAAAGLDRDTPGRAFCIGAVNDAIGLSSR